MGLVDSQTFFDPKGCLAAGSLYCPAEWGTLLNSSMRVHFPHHSREQLHAAKGGAQVCAAQGTAGFLLPYPSMSPHLLLCSIDLAEAGLQSTQGLLAPNRQENKRDSCSQELTHFSL